MMTRPIHCLTHGDEPWHGEVICAFEFGGCGRVWKLSGDDVHVPPPEYDKNCLCGRPLTAAGPARAVCLQCYRKRRSAEVLLEFVRLRPELEAFVTNLARDPYKAPESRVELVGMVVASALENTSEAERKVLKALEGRPAVDWQEFVEMLARPSIIHDEPRHHELDGVSPLCPKCFQDHKGPVGTHALLCWRPHRARGDR